MFQNNGYSEPHACPLPVHDSFDVSNNVKTKQLFSQRKPREFISNIYKDEDYWVRRKRNNEAAKRSREKRRLNDMLLEQKVLELTKENYILKAQLMTIKEKFGINGDNMIDLEQIMATFPSDDQVLNLTRTPKLLYEDGRINDHDDKSGPGYPETGQKHFRHHQSEKRYHYSTVKDPGGQLLNKSCANQSISIEKSGQNSMSPSENIIDLSFNENRHSAKLKADGDVNNSDCVKYSRSRNKANPECEAMGGPLMHLLHKGKNYQNNKSGIVGGASNLPQKLRHKRYLKKRDSGAYPFAHGLKSKYLDSTPHTPSDNEESNGLRGTDQNALEMLSATLQKS